MRDLEREAQPQGKGPVEDLAGRSHRGYVSTCLSPAPAAGSPYSAASPVHSLGSIASLLGRKTELGRVLITVPSIASAKAPCQTERGVLQSVHDQGTSTRRFLNSFNISSHLLLPLHHVHSREDRGQNKKLLSEADNLESPGRWASEHACQG